MKALAKAIPDVTVMLTLEPEELAAKLLFLLRDEGMFHVGSANSELWSNPFEQPYPPERKHEVEMALIEAFAWLEAQGLIVPAPGVNGANGYRRLSRRAKRFQNETEFADYAAARLLPKELLHPRISSAAWLSFMRGAYPTALFEAMREVEIAVREAAGFPASDHGVAMIRRAFHKDTGPLIDPDPQADVGEKEALMSLFAGAIGSYKNPHSHKRVPLDSPGEAAEILVFASHLLRIVDSRS